MGFLSNLISKLTGGSSPRDAEQASATQRPPSGPSQSHQADKLQSTGGATITVSVMGPRGPVDVKVQQSEIAERVGRYGFVMEKDLPPLKTTEQWWNEESHKRRMRDGSDKAYAWLTPFVPLEVLKLPELQEIQANMASPNAAHAVVKALRAQVRAKRKAKEPHIELLKALYGAAVAADFADSLEFEGRQPHYMAQFVDARDLESIEINFSKLGYQCISTLGKTDVKWLVGEFGEPAEHQSLVAAWPHLSQNAISRYCWQEVRSSLRDLPDPGKAMQDWLTKLVRMNLSFYKEWEQRVAARAAEIAKEDNALSKAWAATEGPFVVADLETTGLSARDDEIIEIAAAKVEAGGAICGEYSVMVRPSRPVPSEITKLTGITQQMLDERGIPLQEGLADFLAFAGGLPVFFHNAPFDEGFLRNAAARCKLKLANPIHDTLPMARQAWPGLSSYKLTVLAEKVGATATTHRALDDVKATLAVLAAAKRDATARAVT